MPRDTLATAHRRRAPAADRSPPSFRRSLKQRSGAVPSVAAPRADAGPSAPIQRDCFDPATADQLEVSPGGALKSPEKRSSIW